jgi:hypothetical protein
VIRRARRFGARLLCELAGLLIDLGERLEPDELQLSGAVGLTERGVQMVSRQAIPPPAPVIAPSVMAVPILPRQVVLPSNDPAVVAAGEALQKIRQRR